MANVILDTNVYDRDQIEQLKLGLEHGVDISRYSNPVYMALQMSWIRKGLEQKIDVSAYANPEFDWFQMEEIYKGIVGSVDVSKYCKPPMPYDRMREVRLGLEQGVDLSPFVNYGAAELKQLRLALKDNVHIVKYMVEGYDAEQLEVIRKALAEGINIEPYLSKDYRGIALEEIAIGLKKNINVDAYSQTSYSWQQMREIREGLEERLDVSMYSSYMYSASQMREIRLGLEMGLNVSSYKSLMYTASDMHRMRLKLVEIVTGGSSVPMVPGEDGYHEFLFDKDRTGNMFFLQDGSVDFKRSFQYATCKAGETIAIYHEATEGKNGISDDGKVIKAIKGKEKRILSGKDVHYDEKSKSYITSATGWIHLNEDEDLLEIKPAVIKENINSIAGKVVINGNVEVLGNIESGSRVEVEGDLVVNGHVGEAYIKCGGNLIIRGGINGNENAIINVGESLICMYIESCDIHSMGDVRADYILSSKVVAKGEVIVSGSRGSIIGSSILSYKGIQCEKAGNEALTKTELSINYSEEIELKAKQLIEKRQRVLKELDLLKFARDRYKSRYSVEVRNIHPDFIKLENAIYTKKLELEEIINEDKIVSEQIKMQRKYNITVKDNVFDGVCFRIDKAKYESIGENRQIVVENLNGKIRVTRG